MINVFEGLECVVTEERREAAQRVAATLVGGQRVERARIDEAHQDAGPSTSGLASGLTSKVMNTGPSSDSAWPEKPSARQNGVG